MSALKVHLDCTVMSTSTTRHVHVCTKTLKADAQINIASK